MKNSPEHKWFETTIKNLGLLFSIIVPLSILLGSLAVYTYLSKNNSATYFIEVVSNPSALIVLTLYFTTIIFLTGLITLCGLFFIDNVKLNKLNLKQNLEQIYKEKRIKNVHVVIFLYSSLLPTLITLYAYFNLIPNTWLLSITSISVSLIASITSILIIEAKSGNSVLQHILYSPSSESPFAERLGTHLLFMVLTSLNVLVLSILIYYIPRSGDIEAKFGDWYFLISVASIILVIYMLNHSYITKKHTIPYITCMILIIAMSLNIYYDEKDTVIRNALALNKEGEIIIPKDIKDKLKIEFASQSKSDKNVYEISYENVIISTSSSFIIRSSNEKIVNLPKSQIIGEISTYKKGA